MDNLSVIQSHFPNYKKEVESLFIKDNDFMVFVNEYLCCKKQVKRLADANNEERAMGYSDTIKELEQELLAMLKRQKLTKQLNLSLIVNQQNV